MKRFKVVLTPNAQEDIRKAFAWLEEENPIHAARWISEIRSRVTGLETLPESHAIAPESEAFECDIRQLLVGRGTSWRVFYTVDGDQVQVLHVRHGRQDYWRS
ncbi:MAG: type II toxin-antitoxin system RelE/ParE family toxin [Magnetococcales bacterium]|nr:type II toxin-antitoxin system RelE/ParE family toxin [Magnetococcales bacterium]